MSAFSLLLSSARRRIGETGLLIVSTALSVMAIGVFAAAGASEEFVGVASSRESIRSLLVAASIIMVIFVALSGWFYAEHYLKKRKRELATWLLVGMGKPRAALIISAEFAVSGLIAFAIGVGLGALFSRLFALILAALMRERSAFSMRFGGISLAAGALTCALQWALASAHSVIIVIKSNIVSLMRAEKESETPPSGRALRSGLGVALILAGYSGALFAHKGLATLLMIPVLLVTVAGSFLVFDAVVPALIAATRGRRGGMAPARLIASAQLAFRSSKNARGTAFAAILVAVAASALGTVLALSTMDTEQSRVATPHEIELDGASGEAIARVEAILSAASPEAGTRGAAGKPARRDLLWLPGAIVGANGADHDAEIISWTAWRESLAALGERPAPIAEGRVRSSTAGWLICKDGKAEKVELRVGDRRIALMAYPERCPSPLSSMGASGFTVVSDALWAELLAQAGTAAQRRSVTWDGVGIERSRIAAKALKAAGANAAVAGTGAAIVRSSFLDEEGKIFGVLLFIGGFLAAVFIIAAASILAFRSVEDAREDRGRYRILSELGATEEVLREALARQNAIAFGLPLALGLCHTCMALVMMRNITGVSSAMPTIAVSAGAIAAFLVAGGAATRGQLRAVSREAAGQ
jgi:putative ABC transport system permease protein